ncbi:aldehyde dehydrogenase family domain-containing protein [Ditylenchus destructor]|uniref:2-hydroxyacyl-CoA lyase 2 n=1 Tax=Ditylenchus destructor TaxID=166010 RepID=A0AAD4MFW6_9BILA|nr:aldehyde dehydrogenase family domain-containing protein [Ditylenchus destructor]
MQAHLPFTRSETFYTMDSGGLGYGMPASVGVALGKPGSRVVCLIGDGSSMYSIQALWSAAQNRLPITFVILNNRRYAALQDFAPVFGFSPTDVVQAPSCPTSTSRRSPKGNGMRRSARDRPGRSAQGARRGPGQRRALCRGGPGRLTLPIVPASKGGRNFFKPSYGDKPMKISMLINGERTDARDGATFERRNPLDGSVATIAPAATTQDAIAAVGCRSRGLQDLVDHRPQRTQGAAHEGFACAGSQGEAFAAAVAAETGASAIWAGFNVHLAAGMLLEAASLTTQISGEVTPSDVPGNMAMAVRQPAGVVPRHRALETRR